MPKEVGIILLVAAIAVIFGLARRKPPTPPHARVARGVTVNKHRGYEWQTWRDN